MYHCDPSISQFKMGAVVIFKSNDNEFHTTGSGNSNGLPSLVAGIGHVTGFSLNSTKEVIVVVKWEDGKSSAIHPGNIEVLP